MKYLIVEDNAEIASVIQYALINFTHGCEFAASSYEAMRKTAASEFEFIILDLNLPDEDGREVIKKIRSQNNQVPVIVVSSQKSLGDRIECLELGADDFLEKPFCVDELQLRVQAVLRRTYLHPARSIGATGGPLLGG